MEELRSTKILDREIEEDSQRKSRRVLDNAKAEVREIIAAVDSRIAEAEAIERGIFSEKLERFRRDSDASIPLENARFLVSFEGNVVISAIDAYLSRLTRDQRLLIIAKWLGRYNEVFGTQTVIVKCFGITAAEAKRVVSEMLSVTIGDFEEVAFAQTGLEKIEGIHIREGMTLETHDKAIRARATLDDAVSELLDLYSEELTTTLFGGRLPS
ncbi:MAG: hypothetical protein Ta2A_11350 [Treponemataceae bacterium]|nr:MAG: hypothetical protein Ta2A_11350 [Treponemataceae bacterium]